MQSDKDEWWWVATLGKVEKLEGLIGSWREESEITKMGCLFTPSLNSKNIFHFHFDRWGCWVAVTSPLTSIEYAVHNLRILNSHWSSSVSNCPNLADVKCCCVIMDKCYSASSSIMAQWLVLFICNVASISLRVQLLMRFFFFEIEWLGALQVT